MHPIARLILILPLAAVSLAGASHAAGVAFDPPAARLDDAHCADSTFVVRLVVSGAVDHIQGFSIVFRFDPEVIRPLAVRPGEVLADQPAPIFFWPYEDRFASGVMQIDAAVLGATCCAPAAGGGNSLAEIEFSKLEGGAGGPRATALELQLVDFRNHHNRPIAMDAADGRVELLPCILPLEAMSWGAIKARAGELPASFGHARAAAGRQTASARR